MTRRSVLLLLALLAALLPAAARADGWSPLGIAVTSEAGFPDDRGEVDGMRLGFFGTANARMRGLSLSLFANGVLEPYRGDGDAAGLQVAGLYNFSEASAFGLVQLAGFINGCESGAVFQASSFMNFIGGAGQGIQLAGFLNQTSTRYYKDETFNGVQIAGFINAAKKMNGVQITGLLNLNRESMNGLQIGFINYAERMNGVQLGGFNIADQDSSALQIGLINVAARRCSCFQIGVYNVADKQFEGVQLGLINQYNASQDAPMLPLLRICF